MTLEREPSVQQLRALLEVLDTGSFARAASHLGIKKSTLWRQVDRLSQILGLPLFESVTPEQVTPTPYALALRDKAQYVVDAAGALASLAGVARGQLVGEFRIGCYPSHVSQFMAQAAADFQKLTRLTPRYP